MGAQPGLSKAAALQTKRTLWLRKQKRRRRKRRKKPKRKSDPLARAAIPPERLPSACQRRSKNASAGRSKSTSAKLVRRPPEPGALGLGIRLGSDYPPAYPSWQGVGVACSD